MTSKASGVESAAKIATVSYLISHLLQKYKESGADLFRDQNAFIALSEAFRNMLKDPQLSPVYLAVDALDECAQGRSDLIYLISTSLTLSRRSNGYSLADRKLTFSLSSRIRALTP